MYYTKEDKAGFCTISESKPQDASAIWADMESVFRDIHLKSFKSLKVDTIHFWSDGPSKQYKKQQQKQPKFLSTLQSPSNTGFPENNLELLRHFTWEGSARWHWGNCEKGCRQPVMGMTLWMARSAMRCLGEALAILSSVILLSLTCRYMMHSILYH